MRNAQFLGGNDNLTSPIAIGEESTANSLSDNRELCGNPRAGLYSECIGCPDLKKIHNGCNGPKLAAFLNIMLVRGFHRRLRDHYGITNKQIADKTNPWVSKGTVAEYFSKEEKDFLWTTVAYIDYALLSIIRGSDIDQIHDNPCPASSTKIQAMMAEKDSAIATLDEECARLKNRVATNSANSQRELEAQRSIYERMIDHLKRQMEDIQSQLDKEESRSKNYLKRIDNKNLVIVASIMAVLLETGMLVAYIVWDFMHIGAGIFW